MANYTKNTPGVPTSGRYAIGDTVTDSVGIVWHNVAAGQPGNWLAVPGGATVGSPRTTQSVGAVQGTLVTAAEYGQGAYHTTVLTLAARAVAITNANAYGGSKLYTFPAGRICLLSSRARIALAVLGTRTGTINDNSTVDWALGSVTASNVALTSTMVDMCAVANEAAFAASGNGLGAYAASGLVVPTSFDGTSTAIDMFLNFGFSDADDIDGDSTIEVTGEIEFSWVFLGDH